MCRTIASPSFVALALAATGLCAVPDCRNALPALRAAAATSSSAEAHAKLAICETELGRPDLATASFEQVTKLRPRDWEAWNNLGANLIAIQQPTRALAAFAKATTLDPDAQLGWFNYGSALLQLDKPDEAFRALARAKALPPEDREIANAWHEAARRVQQRAGTAVHRRQYAEAKGELLTVRPALEKSAAWNNLLGYAEFRLNEPTAALEHLQAALAMEPQNENYLLDIGEFLIHYRANTAAREMFEAGARTMPESIRVQFLLAVSLVLDNRRDDAVPVLRRIISHDPEFEPAYKALAECYGEAKDWDAVVKLGEQFAARNPKSASGPYLKGLGLVGLAAENRGAVEPAVEDLRRALKLDPGLTDAHFQLAQAYQWEERIPEAIAELENTIKLDPQHQRAHYRLAMLYRRTGRADLAEKEMKAHTALRARARPMVLLVETRKR